MKGPFNYYGTFDFNSGSVIFDGDNQTIYKYSTNSGTFNNVVFSSSTGTTIGNGDITVTGNLTINQGYFSPGSATVTVGGNWTNNGTFTHNGRTVQFDGDTAQVLS